jgi:SAM-dependent methyltransferase
MEKVTVAERLSANPRSLTMLRDRIKWNEKYRQQDYPTESSAILKEFFGMAPGRSALDIAAGSGRNALFLAERGFVVEAVDIAEEGLALFAGRHPAIRPICADLDTYDIPGERYDLILNMLYLNRRLFPQIRRSADFRNASRDTGVCGATRALPRLFSEDQRTAAQLSVSAHHTLPRRVPYGSG